MYAVEGSNLNVKDHFAHVYETKGDTTNQIAK